MESAPSRKNLKAALLGLILVGTLVRIIGCLLDNPLDHLFSDPSRHWMNGKRFFHPDMMGAGDPIVYQVYIFLLQWVTDENRFLVGLACGLMSAFMPWTYYRAAREFGLSKTASQTAWALIIWMPSLVTFYHYFMMETLLIALIGLAFWMSARHLRKGTTGSFLVAVGCWTLACLTKTVAIPLAIVAVGYIWWMKSMRWTPSLWGAGLVILMLVPNSVRTYRYLDWVAPFGNSWLAKIHHRSGAMWIEIYRGKNQYRFGSPSSFVQPLEPLSPWMMQRGGEDTVVKVYIDRSHGKRDWVEAYHNLQYTWQDWMQQWGENIFLFFFAPAWPDGDYREWGGWFSYMSRWLIGPLVFVILECNLREFRQRRFTFIPITVTAFTLFLMFQNMAMMEGRFRKPLEPLLLLNLVWVYGKRSEKTVPEIHVPA